MCTRQKPQNNRSKYLPTFIQGCYANSQHYLTYKAVNTCANMNAPYF